MIVFWTVVAAFANYRLATSLSQEEGPFRLFEIFRNLFLADNWLGRGVRCFKCVSFWVALPLAFLVGIDSWQHGLLLWLGIAGLPLLLERYWAR